MTKKKWVDPIERLLAADQEATSVTEYMEKSKLSRKKNADTDLDEPNQENPLKIQSFTSESVLEIQTDKIIRWKFKDRPETELGDISALSREFLQIGQQQPCVVRPYKQEQNKYELIIGERRWLAATNANVKLKVIIKDLSDTEAALAQAAENSNRKDLSDYAKGMSYAKQIERGILQQKDLTEKLGLSKQQVSRLLSFDKIPQEIITAIGDMTKISAGTAEKIKQLANKGEIYINEIILLADKLRIGKLGFRKLEETIKKKLEKTIAKDKNIDLKKIYGKDGRHMFTWRLDNNNKPSIHFPKDILKLITEEESRIDILSEQLTKVLQLKIINID